MVILFFKRLWNLIKLYLPVDSGLYKKRISICKKCEFYNKSIFAKRCGKLSDAFDKNTIPCGCDLRLKARMEAMQCPKKLW